LKTRGRSLESGKLRTKKKKGEEPNKPEPGAPAANHGGQRGDIAN